VHFYCPLGRRNHKWVLKYLSCFSNEVKLESKWGLFLAPFLFCEKGPQIFLQSFRRDLNNALSCARISQDAKVWRVKQFYINSSIASQIQRLKDLFYDIQIKYLHPRTVQYVNVIILGETSETKLILKLVYPLE